LWFGCIFQYALSLLSSIHANLQEFCSLLMAKDFGMGQLNAFSTFHSFLKTFRTWVWVFSLYLWLVATFAHFSITKEMSLFEVYTWLWRLFAQSYLEPKGCHKDGGHGSTNLTLGLSFGHNLCFRCPNGPCEPTLDIYVPRAFQRYKYFFNPMGFDPCNYSLKIREPTETPIPKMKAHLGVGVFILSRSSTLSTSQEHEMWLPGFTFGLHPCKPLPWSRAQG
jgi:hypothetical protein